MSTHYFHAEANSLGGFIEAPLHKVVPTQAAASLPSVGGHVQQRTGAFNFEELIHCSAAYTRVAGGYHPGGGPAHTTITSVVEDLNIMEVVKAKRVVAQISVEHPTAKGFPHISFTGTHFDGLKIGGIDALPAMSSNLLPGGSGAGVAGLPVDWPLFNQTGSAQAGTLVAGAKKGGNAFQWLIERYGWMTSADPKALGPCLCSLVDAINPADPKKPLPGTWFGHAVSIPNFGKIFFGELLATSPTAIHLSMVRAELGCAVNGQVSAAAARGIGVGIPPG